MTSAMPAAEQLPPELAVPGQEQATPVLDQLPWWNRVKLWWHQRQLRSLAKRARAMDCIIMLGESHHRSVEHLAEVLTYVEKSGSLNMQPKAKQKVLDGLHLVMRGIAIGEQMASPEHFKVTLDRFIQRRMLHMSNRMKRQASARVRA